MKTEAPVITQPDPIVLARRITNLQTQGRISAVRALQTLRLLWQ